MTWYRERCVVDGKQVWNCQSKQHQWCVWRDSKRGGGRVLVASYVDEQDAKEIVWACNQYETRLEC